MTVSVDELRSFSKLSARQQYSTLINLCSVEEPEVGSELMKERFLTRLLIAYEVRKQILLGDYDSKPDSDICDDVIENLRLKYQQYVEDHHKKDGSFSRLWDIFEENLSSRKGKIFLRSLYGEINDQRTSLEASFYSDNDKTTLEKMVGLLWKRPREDEEPIYLGDTEKDPTINTAAIIIKPSIIRTFLSKHQYLVSTIKGITGIKGLTGEKLAAVIDSEYTKRGLCGQFEIYDQNTEGLNLHDLAKKNPHYVMISLPSDMSLPYGVAVAREVRKILPQTKIVMGGKTFGSAVAPDCEARTKLDESHKSIRDYVLGTGVVDAVMVGRAEETLPLFLDDLLNGREIKTVYRDTRTTKFMSPLYSIRNGDRFQKEAFSISEGCKNKPCTVCSPGNFFLGFGANSPEQIESDLIQLKEARGIEDRIALLIIDSNAWSPIVDIKHEGGRSFDYTEKRARITEIADLFRRHNVEFFSFVDSHTAEDLELMQILRKGGMRLGLIGIESLNGRTYRKIKQESPPDYRRIAQNFKDAGIYSHVTYVFDPDVDTIESARASAKKLRELGFDYAVFFIASPLIGIGSSRYVKDRLLDPLEYTERRSFLNQAYRTSETSIKTARKMLDEAYKKFYNGSYFSRKALAFRKREQEWDTHRTLTKLLYALVIRQNRLIHLT